jgi:hypothetical protein
VTGRDECSRVAAGDLPNLPEHDLHREQRPTQKNAAFNSFEDLREAPSLFRSSSGVLNQRAV